MAWMMEVLWSGEVKLCKDCGNGFPQIGLKYDASMVWGLVIAKDKKEALDRVTAFMIKHADDVVRGA